MFIHLHSLQWQMPQQSPAVVGKSRWRSGECGKPECGLRRTKAQTLRAERRAVAADDLDVALHIRPATEEVRHGLLVKIKVKAGAEVFEQRDEDGFERNGTGSLHVEMVPMNGEAPPLRGRHRRVDEFMLHLAGAKIDEFAVREVKQQQIIEQWCPVPRSKSLGCLNSKSAPSAVRTSRKYRFVNVRCVTSTCVSSRTPGEFPLVNAFVEKAPKIAMNGEDVFHDAKGDFTKLFLVQPGNRDGTTDGHGRWRKEKYMTKKWLVRKFSCLKSFGRKLVFVQGLSSNDKDKEGRERSYSPSPCSCAYRMSWALFSIPSFRSTIVR